MKVWLNDPNRKAKPEGCPECPRREDHAVPRVGVESINPDAVKLGCAGIVLRARHRGRSQQQKMQLTSNCTRK
jgi:hypothetical protein